jgi:heat shock protein beta
VRSEEPTENDGYTADELKVIETTREHHTFQTEVNKLMDILINSIYSSSDVFLRELISNAADALDKIRYKSISDPSQLDSNPSLEIRIKVDQEHRTITISDTGVGMTRQELIDNLGTIAQSGTTNFLNSLKNNEGTVDLGLIGQFGVGFYSAFLVADRVTVHSKSNDDSKQYIWDASSQREYQVYVDPKQDLGRGTTIVLHVKESTPEFLNEAKLKSLVKQYSEFIDFPIYVWASHEEEVEAAEDTDLGEEIDIQDVEEGAKEEKKKVTVWGWERVNELKPLWYRKPADITEDEYFSFYKAVFHDTSDPIAHLHFNAEGDINFKSILFVPSRAPSNLYDLTEKKTDMKLYVKRVFITDDFSEIIPRYLSFIKGVVDSDDLPLNVNRELLQKNKLLKIMKKKLTRKAIALIQDLAKDNDKYLSFWDQFGTSIKLGVMEDDSNKQRLEKLLRFHSSKTDGLTSFDEYISRMKEGQKDIYFFASQDEKANMMKSPLLEKLLKKDYEVLFMVDPIDEYLFQTGGLAKYEEKNIVNVAKENLDLGDDDEEEDDDEDVDKVCDYLKEILTGKISKCKVSSRLTDSPSALTSSQWGWTGNMEKLAKAQALGDKSMHKFYKGQKVLEINPKHPIIIELKNRLVAGADSNTKDVAYLMYETALLSSGYELDDQPAFARRVQNVLRLSLGLETLQEEVVVEKAETASAPDEDDDEMEL